MRGVVESSEAGEDCDVIFLMNIACSSRLSIGETQLYNLLFRVFYGI